ncbi:hypothetical protein WJX75_000558 [Coccomyxa subellipsoidea]|uniref:BZIP domain-containing protein n=1 Tax=Coccomyxa subellipsoidea TaxID=248742 RepID=A0ABR2Z230_9CHLO
MGDGGRKGQRDTVPQRQAEQVQPQGAILHFAQRGGSGTPGSGSTGLQGASGSLTNPSEDPTTGGAALEEQPDADSNTREQASAGSGDEQQILPASDQGTPRRITRSVAQALARQSSAAGPSSTGEPARGGGSSYSQPEGSRPPTEGAKGRRKLPEPDYDAIEDPRERQRQQRLARIRASAAVAREKKRQEMQDMETRADELHMENQRLRMLLAQREQESLRLRQEVGRMMERGAPPPLQLPPPQMGAPLPDLAAIASGRYGGIRPAGVPPPAAAHNFPEGGYGVPDQAVPDIPNMWRPLSEAQKQSLELEILNLLKMGRVGALNSIQIEKADR